MLEFAASAPVVHHRSGGTVAVALGIIVVMLVIAYVAERFIRSGGRRHQTKSPSDSSDALGASTTLTPSTPTEETRTPRPPTQVPL